MQADQVALVVVVVLELEHFLVTFLILQLVALLLAQQAAAEDVVNLFEAAL